MAYDAILVLVQDPNQRAKVAAELDGRGVKALTFFDVVSRLDFPIQTWSWPTTINLNVISGPPHRTQRYVFHQGDDYDWNSPRSNSPYFLN